ncbi:flagellar type III secretion system protein FlhB [Candidatus Methylospira mobilis]|uniref:Flagellar biosynthetic protein FlhB n=1 Tax=Candidatus Methylospira mobilis TaxID=1808979 RepID=A0A5Q0BJS3_9GAMM|nr:flagellar biosynthesis protein FlhB [Candidatus Methylospira mobilis]QFY42434.1 flagellar type III secretion system protein FlhB [Candidatus Methylospira mobilis]WNV04464.1 flagellar biosynthesis protein FlhB [Candidatus Methylospira mobilis]
MAEDSDQEKTEDASSRRLEKAREEGDVPRSRELVTFASLMMIGAGLWISIGNIIRQLNALLTGAFAFDPEHLFNPELPSLAQNVLISFMPVIAILLLGAIATPLAIGGWLFSSNSLAPNFGRMNPINWVSNLFSTHTLVELIKAIAKTLLVGTIVWLVLQRQQDEVIGLLFDPMGEDGGHLAELLWFAYFSMAGSLGIVALIDAPYQIWHYHDKLKMTKEEIRQESKESEGNPQIKGRIRQQQRAMARRRMMTQVPTADVVITNPTHYAVALKYEQSRGNAPYVVAKGAGELAAQIRKLAISNAVPILEAPALARTLFRHVELDDQIPTELYSAVAEVIAYVFQLKAFKASGGPQPETPDHFEIPEYLQVPPDVNITIE